MNNGLWPWAIIWVGNASLVVSNCACVQPPPSERPCIMHSSRSPFSASSAYLLHQRTALLAAGCVTLCASEGRHHLGTCAKSNSSGSTTRSQCTSWQSLDIKHTCRVILPLLCGLPVAVCQHPDFLIFYGQQSGPSAPDVQLRAPTRCLCCGYVHTCARHSGTSAMRPPSAYAPLAHVSRLILQLQLWQLRVAFISVPPPSLTL
jgi:hypothetical protein